MKVIIRTHNLSVLDALQTVTSDWTRRRGSLEYCRVDQKTVIWLEQLMASVRKRFGSEISLDVIEDDC